ncbi:protein indeterminate-domain 7-like [Senna tora]|uniref:Protein indeterminate-domain 7-like n=1 Tax=Senna tora TaxID=362788 RepID=A0A834XEB3_9FABA|nr:protein indeterminate-domain 7-like [Senna tora]
MEEEMMNRSNCDDQATASIHLLPPSILLPTPTQPEKKKKSLPGNPDPEIEVIALSPKSLLSANMFTCEICNKGFQREQNLQLHRRGHNLPWKLKQKSSKEDHEGEEEEEGMVKVMKRKVYVCPEVTCVHHNPASALRDLAGIKKHFSKKHGEKKWKCDKCFKRYSVQSDLKAHSKTCGIKEYTCECGTIFSR